ILQLERLTGGSVRYGGVDLATLRRDAPIRYRQRVQVVFQDPYSSLNPRMTVGAILAEPMQVHRILPDVRARRRRVDELLDRVGLSAVHAGRYPHELSGGQRQRVGIARALALEPEFIVCDEAVSALDVSIQAQVINLLEDLRESLGLTYLFISHDLGVVRHICDRVAVMYLGKLVELAETETLFEAPRHPYTQLLLDAVPVPDPAVEAARRHRTIQGEVPSALNPPPGCVFHPRCSIAVPACRRDVPRFAEAAPAHWLACPET
ncbi:MAG: ABC transporter ATP-binding protein, partial [Alphaproteobacteria bacterium]